jgi:putative transposase
MDILSATTKYTHHRFPVEIIRHVVWPYFRFCLSFCDVEELLLERGVVVTYNAIRKWCHKFSQQYANQLRRRRPRPGDKWQREQDQRAVNRLTHLMLGFKSFWAAYCTIAGIEVMHALRKGCD